MPENESAPIAWEAVTPRGVAAFAQASTTRLLVVQGVVALAVALTVAWFLFGAWCPVIRQGIQHLPDEGEIRAGQLVWHGSAPRLLASGSFIAFSVDLDHAGEIRSPAHLEVEFGRETFLIHSLLGYLELRYPSGWIVEFNREQLAPWWGAWQPMILGLVALGVIGQLLVTWALLAALYALPLWVLVFLLDRPLRIIACWRMAGAALLPGALAMIVGLVLYGFGVVDLVGLGFITAGHFVLGWIYLFVGSLFLPRATPPDASPKNPFARPPA